MCVDDCPDDIASRRSFLAGATATMASLGLPKRRGTSRARKRKTRPRESSTHPSIQHGRVVFKHNGVDTIDGYLARPKASGVYPRCL
jgi:hypothetical protein